MLFAKSNYNFKIRLETILDLANSSAYIWHVFAAVFKILSFILLENMKSDCKEHDNVKKRQSVICGSVITTMNARETHQECLLG
jgi:hypothetical protein